MKEYIYEVYYQFDGRSHSDPFANKKSKNEIKDALDRFEKELPTYLNDPNASVTSKPIQNSKNRIKVTIRTIDQESSVESAVNRCLQSWDLRANLLHNK